MWKKLLEDSLIMTTRGKRTWSSMMYFFANFYQLQFVVSLHWPLLLQRSWRYLKYSMALTMMPMEALIWDFWGRFPKLCFVPLFNISDVSDMFDVSDVFVLALFSFKALLCWRPKFAHTGDQHSGHKSLISRLFWTKIFYVTFVHLLFVCENFIYRHFICTLSPCQTPFDLDWCSAMRCHAPCQLFAPTFISSHVLVF